MNKENTNEKIWLSRPARIWEEAFPIGNGRLGGMVFGDPHEERIALNTDELWSGYGKEKLRLHSFKELFRIRKLTLAGRYRQAEERMQETFLNEWTESYLPLGTLRYRFAGEGRITGYKRELDLSSGIASCFFLKDGCAIRSEAYCSCPAQAMAVKISCERETDIEFWLDSVLCHETDSGKDCLFLYGTAPSCVQPVYYECDDPVRYDERHPGMGFSAGLRVESPDGRVRVMKDGRIGVAGAKSVVCYLTATTGYDMESGSIARSLEEVKSLCAQKLSATSGWLEERVREEHIRDFTRLYDRVKLSLCGSSVESSAKFSAKLSTEDRIKGFQKDGPDAGLFELFFHFGRYLLISSSREGTMAANLQGIWNDKLRAPFSSNYTANINLQMNYWLADKVNLPELKLPLFELLRHLGKSGERTAREQFGCGGWTVNHNIDCWYQTSPVGKLSKKPPSKYGYFPAASGWLCLDIWDHYLYTRDLAFLKRYYPTLKGACLFYLDYLTQKDGFAVTAPSTSPENLFYDEEGNPCALSVASTVDTAVIRMLFDSFSRSCALLNTDADLRLKIEATSERLPGYGVGRDKGLREWSRDFEQVYPRHRHVSHLVGLYPGRDKALAGDYREACKETLRLRTKEGTAWSKAWKSCLWARLSEGEEAYDQLCQFVKPFYKNEVDYEESGCYSSLFCAPPLQVDGNLGFTAAILEMLVRDGEESLELLPAVPAAWKTGSLSGVRVIGGHILHFSWEDGIVKTAELYGGNDQVLLVKMNGLAWETRVFERKTSNLMESFRPH